MIDDPLEQNASWLGTARCAVRARLRAWPVRLRPTQSCGAPRLLPPAKC